MIIAEPARSVLMGVALCVLAALATAQEPASSHVVPFFPAASDSRHEGLVRIVNLSDKPGTLDMVAVDAAGRRIAGTSLTIGANEAAHFDSDDLESGNSDARLTGAGQGDWLLEPTADLDIEVQAGARTSNGVGATPPEGDISLTLERGKTRVVTASELEDGGEAAQAESVQMWIEHAGSVVEPGHLDFVVKLSRSSSSTVTVDYEDHPNERGEYGATEGQDYAVTGGNLVFDPGDTEKTIRVEIFDDGVLEPGAEILVMTLKKPVNAEFRVGGDPRPCLYSAGVDICAPNLCCACGQIRDEYVSFRSGESLDGREDYGFEGEKLRFRVYNYYKDRPVVVGYRTLDLGAAVGGTDYVSVEDTLSFASNEREQKIEVQTLNDNLDEDDEYFTVELFSPPGGSPVNIGVSRTQGIIQDTRHLAKLSVADAVASEGDGKMEFVISLEHPLESRWRGSYYIPRASGEGAATAGRDYESIGGIVRIESGETSASVFVPILDDSLVEGDETLSFTVFDAVHPTQKTAVGTILDDDGPRGVELSTVPSRVGEGDGATEVAVMATLIGAVGAVSASETRVLVSVSGSGAAYAVDFAAVADFEITIPAGVESGRGSFVLVPEDDLVDEADERLSVSGRSEQPVTGTTLMLMDNDVPPPPAMPALSVSGSESDEGGTAQFRVTLSATGDESVRVAYATRDGTAVAGEDYVAAEGSLTFAPGETSKTIPVTLLDDDVDEPEEQYTLELSSPSNATLSVSAATGTILDDDARSCMAPSPGRVLLFEPSLHAHRQGFVRIINHSSEAGTLLVEAIDDAGMRFGPIPLSIGAGAATHFNSDDLEAGNADKGLPKGIGASGEGTWRLELRSELDIEVLSYMRTRDGFVTALHDRAPASSGQHRAVFVNPGGNADQVSRLRLVNWGTEDARITISGTDDMGIESPEVVVVVPAGTAREWTAADLESGTSAEGALGDGEGKWRLTISSDRPLVVLSLIENPTGHLTNLSTLPITPGREMGRYAVPLFPSASDPLGRQGFVRVANGPGESDEVRIKAFDRTVWAYPPVELELGAGQAMTFNSHDLELGNPNKGLTGSTGAGEGDWWLELSGGTDLGVGSYIRTTDGFLTSMHDLVPEWDGGYRVVFFNPAENPNQVSVLWLVNPGDTEAAVTIAGVDDDGVSPGTAVRARVPAGSARRLTSSELETGESDVIDSGALGDGKGKWRLQIDSDRPVRVLSLIENPTGHLTNLSTAPDCGPPAERLSSP